MNQVGIDNGTALLHMVSLAGHHLSLVELLLDRVADANQGRNDGGS